MAPMRPIQLKMMVSEEEQQMLRDLAENQGLTVSDYVRQLIRREHLAAVHGSLPKLGAPFKPPPTVVKRPKVKPKK